MKPAAAAASNHRSLGRQQEQNIPLHASLPNLQPVISDLPHPPQDPEPSSIGKSLPLAAEAIRIPTQQEQREANSKESKDEPTSKGEFAQQVSKVPGNQVADPRAPNKDSGIPPAVKGPLSLNEHKQAMRPQKTDSTSHAAPSKDQKHP